MTAHTEIKDDERSKNLEDFQEKIEKGILADLHRELRREYAIAALQGYLASPAAPVDEYGDPDSSTRNLARLAFQMADAMIERENVKADKSKTHQNSENE